MIYSMTDHVKDVLGTATPLEFPGNYPRAKVIFESKT